MGRRKMIMLVVSLFSFLIGLFVYDYYTNKTISKFREELTEIRISLDNICSEFSETEEELLTVKNKLDNYENDVRLMNAVMLALKKPTAKKSK